MAKGKGGAKGFNQVNMMQQLQKMQEQLQQTQAQLAVETVEFTAGGGAVKIVITGDQHIQAIEINPEVLEDADAEFLQDLLLTAFNGALEKSRAMAADRLGPLAGGMDLPF